ncbi:MAG: type II toxin-antitoxin system prevent-host-death family antitoxin [Acidobacteria bacterium]|nr:type II toxin-antitoxin system prevent-host-death family antitoxin [Acidobacteriota bacterium]
MRRSIPEDKPPRQSEVRVAEMKANFSEYLRRASAGERVTVMKRDRPVAQLVPVPDEKHLLRLRKPIKDPTGLLPLLDVPPVGRGKVKSLKLLLEDRRRR